MGTISFAWYSNKSGSIFFECILAITITSIILGLSASWCQQITNTLHLVHLRETSILHIWLAKNKARQLNKSIEIYHSLDYSAQSQSLNRIIIPSPYPLQFKKSNNIAFTAKGHTQKAGKWTFNTHSSTTSVSLPPGFGQPKMTAIKTFP